MQRDDLTVLISGAGIAGSTLAALLGRAGHRATVVERDQGVRSSVHNEPGTAVALHPGAGSPGVAFMFRSRARIDHRDPDAARQLLKGTYRNVGWRTEELLSAYLAAEDVYFDSVSPDPHVVLLCGDVTLLGDAASCVSLFGDGSSSAMEGAATLAASLHASPHEIPAALARYESAHRAVTRRRQRNVPHRSHLLIPTSQLGITLS